MKGTITTTRVESGNADVLISVAPDVFDHQISPARLSDYLASPGNLMIVALDNGVVVGQVRGVIHPQPDAPTQLYIDNLGVAPSHQRRGIARALVEALFAWGRELGASEGWVGTEPDNAAALALYGKLSTEPAEPFMLFTLKIDMPD